jgi:hypothetical protein
MPQFDWLALLGDVSQAVIASRSVRAHVSAEQRTRRWLGPSPATEQQIAAAELRLGAQLPPSYRSFLEVANGWGCLDSFIWKLWPAEEIDWFGDRRSRWVETLRSGPLARASDDMIDRLDPPQERWPAASLRGMLEISELGDSAILLLNPAIIKAREWEAWMIADWMPSARRYPSFWELMKDRADFMSRA